MLRIASGGRPIFWSFPPLCPSNAIFTQSTKSKMSGYYGNPPPGTGYNGGPPPPPPGQGRPDGTYPVYQIDFTAVASGKRISSTKRRVRW